MNHENLITFLDKTLSKMITPEFLERVKVWSKYNDEILYDNCSISVENKGIFKRISSRPTFEFIDNTYKCNNFKTIETIYDVTLIKNSSRCDKYDGIVIISERSENSTLYIYAISENDPNIPNFEQLKTDFESKNYMNYNSLIDGNYEHYKLQPYDDNSERINDFTAIFLDLESLSLKFTEFYNDLKNV